MASINAIKQRTRLELGDFGDHFRASDVGDGVTLEFDLPVTKVVADTLRVWVGPTELNDNEYVLDAEVGSVTFIVPPPLGQQVSMHGKYYDLFLDDDLDLFVMSALTKHAHNVLPDTTAEEMADRLQPVEEHPVALLAAIEGLWAVISQIARDVNVTSPDGYSIPRQQRYQQLMQLVAEKEDQYRYLAQNLNIGVGRIEMMNLRRVAGRTGRYVPVYRPQEIDETEMPTRVYPPRDALAPETDPFAEDEEEEGEGDA